MDELAPTKEIEAQQPEAATDSNEKLRILGSVTEKKILDDLIIASKEIDKTKEKDQQKKLKLSTGISILSTIHDSFLALGDERAEKIESLIEQLKVPKHGSKIEENGTLTSTNPEDVLIISDVVELFKRSETLKDCVKEVSYNIEQAEWDRNGNGHVFGFELLTPGGETVLGVYKPTEWHND